MSNSFNPEFQPTNEPEDSASCPSHAVLWEAQMMHQNTSNQSSNGVELHLIRADEDMSKEGEQPLYVTGLHGLSHFMHSLHIPSSHQLRENGKEFAKSLRAKGNPLKILSPDEPNL